MLEIVFLNLSSSIAFEKSNAPSAKPRISAASSNIPVVSLYPSLPTKVVTIYSSKTSIASALFALSKLSSQSPNIAPISVVI